MMNRMSEKEFLKGFLEYAEVYDYELDDNLIQTWLDYHHTEYYEIEFIKKKEDDDYDYAADDMNYDAAREKKYK